MSLFATQKKIAGWHIYSVLLNQIFQGVSWDKYTVCWNTNCWSFLCNCLLDILTKLYRIDRKSFSNCEHLLSICFKPLFPFIWTIVLNNCFRIPEITVHFKPLLNSFINYRCILKMRGFNIWNTGQNIVGEKHLKSFI